MLNSNKSFEKSRLGRTSPSPKLSIDSLLTKKPKRASVRMHSSMNKTSGANPAVRIILGLLMLHVVVIGGILAHEHFNGGSKETVKATNAPPSTEAKSTPAEQPNPAVTVTQPISAIPENKTVTEPIKPMELTPVPVELKAPASTADASQTITSLVVSEEATPTPTPAEPEEVIAVLDSEIQDLVVHNPAHKSSSAAPAATTVPSQTSKAKEHIIVSGDVWESVASKYDLSVADLKKANPKAASRPYLYTGDRLYIPARGGAVQLEEIVAVPEQAVSQSYTVVSGDTLSSIARRHKMSLEQIITLNQFSKEQANRLRLGQKIKVQVK